MINQTSPFQKFAIVKSYQGVQSMVNLVESYQRLGYFRLGMASRKINLIALELGVTVDSVLEILQASGVYQGCV